MKVHVTLVHHRQQRWFFYITVNKEVGWFLNIGILGSENYNLVGIN
jgi:hypothetical protein